MGRRGVGQLRRRDQVAAANFRAVHADLPRGVLDQPLHEVGGLRAAGAAVRAGDRGVGEHALRHQVHGLDVVGLRHEADRERAGGKRGVDEPCAHLEQRLRAQRQDLAAVVEREFAVVDHLAAVGVVHHALGARGDPLHRAAELLRRPHDEKIVGIGAALEAEAAADVRRDDADLVLRHMEDVADLHAHAVRVLRRRIERVLVGRAPHSRRSQRAAPSRRATPGCSRRAA